MRNLMLIILVAFAFSAEAQRTFRSTVEFGDGILYDHIVQAENAKGTDTITAVSQRVNLVNCDSLPIHVDAPSDTIAGRWFTVLDSRDSAASNNITVDFGTAKFHEVDADYTISASKGSATFMYVNPTVGWVLKEEN